MPATLLPLARPHSTAAAQALRPPGTSSQTTGNRNAASLSPQVLPVARLGLVPAPAAVSDRLAADVGLQHHRTRFAQVHAGGQLPLLGRGLPVAVAAARRCLQAVVDRDPNPGPGHDVACHQLGPELPPLRSEEHTSELQSLMRISYAVFCLKKKNTTTRLYDRQ